MTATISARQVLARTTEPATIAMRAIAVARGDKIRNTTVAAIARRATTGTIELASTGHASNCGRTQGELRSLATAVPALQLTMQAIDPRKIDTREIAAVHETNIRKTTTITTTLQANMYRQKQLCKQPSQTPTANNLMIDGTTLQCTWLHTTQTYTATGGRKEDKTTTNEDLHFWRRSMLWSRKLCVLFLTLASWYVLPILTDFSISSPFAWLL